MIWYLLYPLRRTTDPATLHEESILRRWIASLGRFVARHSITTVIVTVVIAVCLCVPAPFLDHPAPSLNYPKLSDHAWTTAETFADGAHLVADISIKQVWIHGGWMRALERESLREAVDIQDVLLGPMSNCTEGPRRGAEIATTYSGSSAGSSSAIVHSPLLYWNCSAEAVESDESILSTINSHHVSSENIRLRPSSVFAGRNWLNKGLHAADGLVVSLLYKTGSRAGEIWDAGVEELVQTSNGKWDVYPSNRTTGSKLFKFESFPVRLQDEAIFLSAYALVAIYLFLSLQGVKTVKSKTALLAVIILQACFSTLCGFTLSSSVHIDASTVPFEAHPFIILVLGLENILRLVSEVEKTSPQDPPTTRVATALGAIGHLSLITVTQNLVLLWIVSYLAFPGLAEFCGFAAIAQLIDLAMFLTFFVGMLTLNLRKYGLQDSFDCVPSQQFEEARIPKQTTTRGLLPQQQRRAKRRPKRKAIPSPRTMGTVVAIIFLSMLAWHVPKRNISSYLARKSAALFSWNDLETTLDSRRNDSMFEPTRDSVRWLKMQERETQREISHFAKPEAFGFVARVFDPLVIVLKSADRNPSLYDGSLFPVNSLVFPQFWSFVILFVCPLALVFAVWNFSLNGQEDGDEGTQKSGKISSVNFLPRGHSLDVFMLAADAKQFLGSVGFDHDIRIWSLGSKTVTNQLIVPTSEKHVLWPVATIAIGNKAEWLAICSRGGEVAFWHIQNRKFGVSTNAPLNGHIIACFFTPTSVVHSSRRLLRIESLGFLTDIDVETGNMVSHQICPQPIRSCAMNSHGRLPPRLITITEDESIYISTKREDHWQSQRLSISISIPTALPTQFRYTIIPDLRMTALATNLTTHELHLLDLVSGNPIYTFRPPRFKHRTLRAIHSPPQQCLSCGAIALVSFSVCYTSDLDSSFNMTTLSASHERIGLICLRTERDTRERRCIGFKGGSEKTHSTPHAGVWEATGANGVAGLRRKPPTPPPPPSNHPSLTKWFRKPPQQSSSSSSPKKQNGDTEADEAWEAWTMTARGTLTVHPLTTELFASRVGPITPVARNAIAVGLAEGILVVRFGSVLHDDDDDASGEKAPMVRRAHNHRGLAGQGRGSLG